MLVLTRFERLVDQMRLENPDFDGPNLGCGVEGIRDSFHPCELYQIGVAQGTCHTDGHYLCAECVHLDVTSEYYESTRPSNRGRRLRGRRG